MRALALVALLVVGPLVELYVLLQVGHAVGALLTVVSLLAVSLLGAALLRREGARALREVQAALAAGRVPAREAADGGLVLLAGALLLTPRFVSDVVGLVLLVPPVRAVLRRLLLSYALRRGVSGLLPPQPRRTGRGGSRVVDGDVVEGEVVQDP